MSDDEETASGPDAIGAFILGLAVIPLEAVLWMLLWRWFVLRAFPSLPALGFASAVGISTFAGLIVLDASWAASQSASKKNLSKRSVDRAGMMGIMLLVSWLLHLIIGAHG